ncbi:MAG TPA: sigma factor [Gaiellaceae bacterium]|jgi:RNA polymerase sigma-70 factor (ECF subfamily)
MAGAGEAEHDAAAESDDELLRQIAERDLRAFEILYRRYARPVYGLALRRLRDRDGAEDATRRAFAAIWRSADSYVPERGGGARWLFTVARNTIVDHGEPGPKAAAEDGWPAFRVHAAVAELPEQERVPLELVYWEGRSPSEIAEQLGLPLGTVKTCTRSALARLAVRLDEL